MLSGFGFGLDKGDSGPDATPAIRSIVAMTAADCSGNTRAITVTLIRICVSAFHAAAVIESVHALNSSSIFDLKQVQVSPESHMSSHWPL